ncbi:MAG: prepilin-type N-terminal cleavage/methylation domain-containing protein [Verrucomicrobiota bacterium]
MRFCNVNRDRLARRGGFSLIEVTIAMAIFFVCMFALLSLTTLSLNTARRLEFVEPDIGWVASELSLTNVVEEGFETGDFGDHYPGWGWTRDVFMYPPLEEAGGDIDDQGLYEVKITLNGPGGSSQQHSVLMYRGQGEGANGISRSRTGSSRNSRSSRPTSSRGSSSSSRNRTDTRSRGR